jgi:hypothetical protein
MMEAYSSFDLIKVLYRTNYLKKRNDMQYNEQALTSLVPENIHN